MTELFLVYDTISKKKKAIASAPGATTYEQEVPTGDVDGSNKDFVLSQTPVSIKSVLLFVDGLSIPQSIYDVVLVTKTVTFNTAPSLGQDIYVYYSY